MAYRRQKSQSSGQWGQENNTMVELCILSREHLSEVLRYIQSQNWGKRISGLS